jgi:hypothetical protein
MAVSGLAEEASSSAVRPEPVTARREVTTGDDDSSSVLDGSAEARCSIRLGVVDGVALGATDEFGRSGPSV